MLHNQILLTTYWASVSETQDGSTNTIWRLFGSYLVHLACITF